jgi:hypothetical protein
MNNPHTSAAAQVTASAILQLEAIISNAQGINYRALNGSDDEIDLESLRAARKALKVIEASGALKALQQVQYNLNIPAV